jgi:hypothetical protein
MKKQPPTKAASVRVDKLQAFTPTPPRFNCDVLASYAAQLNKNINTTATQMRRLQGGQ